MDTIISVTSLMQEWDWTENENKGYDPKRITLGSSKKAYWVCSNGHKWQASVKNRVNGAACPYCSGKLPIVGETDLSTLYPNIAAEWHPTKNGSLKPNSVTAKSGKIVWWLGKCGHEWQSTVYHRTEGQQNASRFDFFKYEIVDEREFYERLDRKYSKENTPIND